MAGNGAIAGLVGITAACGYVEQWAAPIIGFIAGVMVVYGVLFIEKYLDDPVGALSAHGMAGIWGTLRRDLRIRAARGRHRSPGSGTASLVMPRSGRRWVSSVSRRWAWSPLRLVFGLSMAAFYAIKKTMGLRVSDDEEYAGLDISQHGMYGYPEQFIPREEYPMRPPVPHVAGPPVAAPAATATQMTADGHPAPRRR